MNTFYYIQFRLHDFNECMVFPSFLTMNNFNTLMEQEYPNDFIVINIFTREV